MMRKTSHRSQSLTVAERSSRVDVRLSAEQVAAAAGVGPTLLARLVRIAAVEPATPDGGEFTAATAARLRKMLRLRADLGVDFFATAIILDLLERLESLEAELDRLRSVR